MAIKAVTMPKWGLAMEEGTIVEWLKKEGETIADGEEVVEIETSKITNVMEAANTGPLRRIVAQEGETLPVGALIGVIADAGDADAEIDAFVTEFQARFEQEAADSDEAAGPVEIDVNGMSLTYEEVGGGDATPIIMVHGYGGDRNNWLFNSQALAEGRRVVMLDLPGHGSSQKTIPDASLDGMAKTVLDFAAALDIAKFHLVGHSMGGAISLRAAKHAPDKVASVATICSAGYASSVNGQFIDSFIAAERRKGMKEAAMMLFADGNLVTRDLVNDLLKFKRLDGVQAAIEALRDGAIADGNAMAGDFSGVTCPVLAIIGTQDQIIPAPDKVPEGVEAVRLDVGHMAHMEDAAAVNAALSAFLAR